MNFKALALTALAATTLGFGGAPKAEARGMSLRQVQWELCDAGHQYRNDVRQGYMTTRQAISEAAQYAVYLQQSNGLSSYGNSSFSSAASHGFTGGSCNVYR